MSDVDFSYEDGQDVLSQRGDDGSSNNGEFTAVDDSDEEMDWEEVTVPQDPPSTTGTDDQPLAGVAVKSPQTIEIILPHKGKRKVAEEQKKSSAKISNAERLTRLESHKIHTIALLANALIRNKWINDRLLQARLMSLTPLAIQNSFLMISKKRQPDAAKRGRLFEAAMMRLTQWWYENFQVLDEGHIRSRTFDQVKKAIENQQFQEDDGEVIRSSKSLMKHALMGRGCRDTSAQLFTALCRALGIPARLVVSLQSVPWQAKIGKPQPKKVSKSKSKTKTDIEVEVIDVDGDEDDMEEVAIPSTTVDVKGKGKAKGFPGSGKTLSGQVSASEKERENAIHKPVIKLRKSKAKGNRLGGSPRRREPGPPLGGYPPVFWTEVFSRPDGRWLPVDPIRYIVNKRRVFEPPAHDKNNRMVYVVGIEEDGYARDVTPRYAKEYGAKTAKVQLGGKGRKEWWSNVMGSVTRPFRLNRDDIEDEEFEMNQVIEGMPTSVVGFKDHPLYVLERHLKREEVIHPKTELGKFRGEPVYPRGNVIPLKTSENWMRAGRTIREGCQPLKWVKHRAVTLHRRRAIEAAQQEGGEVMQGLYSEAQTELYRPDPIINGEIPKNDFGNIDLYVPSMLPPGAAHVPYKGTAKIARQLGFDYAEAVTGFEFRKGKALPVVTGIVIAAEHEETLLEAYWESEQNAEEKERAKKMDRVLKRWTRLVQGLRIRQRLQEQYAGGIQVQIPRGSGEQDNIHQGGGFITDADSIVQPYILPKYEHGLQATEDESIAASRDGLNELLDEGPVVIEQQHSADGDGFESLSESSRSKPQQEHGAPKSMRELAEAAANVHNDQVQDARSLTVTSEATPSNGRSSRSSRQTSGKVTRTGTPSSSTKGSERSARKRVRGTQPLMDSPFDSQDEDDEKRPSPSKRNKPVVTPSTTRVLRSRAPKTPEQLQQEREAEEAFRKAVEE